MRGREEVLLTIDISSTNAGRSFITGKNAPLPCMSARAIFFAPPTFKVAPPIFGPILLVSCPDATPTKIGSGSGDTRAISGFC